MREPPSWNTPIRISRRNTEKTLSWRSCRNEKPEPPLHEPQPNRTGATLKIVNIGGVPAKIARQYSGVDKRLVFQTSGFGGCSSRTKTGTRVHSDVPPERKPEGGAFACNPGTKTGTRVHSPKPPFYETALLSPREICSKHFVLIEVWFAS